ncbi:MAG: cytochrome-c peroxidase [Flavobacteriales bacterium]
MSRVLFCFFVFVGFAFYDSSIGIVTAYNFPDTEYNFSNNPIDENKISLGRSLFYDPILSKDSAISCASCHSSFNAFAHTDHSLSHGINDSIGRRNAPALFNLAWHKSFMWDGAINHLDMQSLAPMTSELEMGESLEHILVKLRRSDYYKKKVFNAYNDSIIDTPKMLKSLSQFLLTLISSNSKFDKVLIGEKQFTDKEKKGYLIYQNNCAQCHTQPLFSSYDFETNGLAIDTTLNDYGNFEISGNPKDSLLFKIPSLRNLSYTYPYMHDGRFNSLNQVINHYNTDTVLFQSIQLNQTQKVDLISFLLTLNDSIFVFDQKHRFPLELIGQQYLY